MKSRSVGQSLAGLPGESSARMGGGHSLQAVTAVMMVAAILLVPTVGWASYVPLAAPLVGSLVFLFSLKAVNGTKPLVVLLMFSVWMLTRDLVGLTVTLREGSGVAELVKYTARAVVPLSAFWAGLYLSKQRMEKTVGQTIVFIGALEIAIGIAQVSIESPFLRAVWVLYSAADKYFPDGALITDRALGTMGNPNAYGVLLGLCVIMLSDFAFRQGARFWVLGLLGAFIVGIVLAGSRSAFFFLAAAVLPFAFTRTRRSTLAVVLLVSALIAALFLPPAHRLVYGMTDASQLLSLNNRLPLWSETLTEWFSGEDWLMGMGRAAFDPEGIAIDNEYLRVLTIYGLVGIALLLLFIALCLRALLRSARWTTHGSFGLAVCAYVLLNAFTAELLASPRVGPVAWLLLGLIVGSRSRIPWIGKYRLTGSECTRRAIMSGAHKVMESRQ